MRQLNRNKNVIPKTIDNINNNNKIATHFAKKYESLYNSVTSNPDEIELLKKRNFSKYF